MSDVMAQWVRDAMSHASMTQPALAAELTKRLHRSFDKAAVNKMAKVRVGPGQKRRLVKADEMYAISEITGFAPPAESTPLNLQQVPLLDQVAAGRLANPSSQIPVEDVPLLAFADLGPGEWFATKVDGSSMNRLSPDGSVVVVNRRDKTLISGRCYIFAVQGETTYKRWQGGDPPYLDPYSTDEVHKPLFVKKKRDFEVIGRVKRTLLDL